MGNNPTKEEIIDQSKDLVKESLTKHADETSKILTFIGNFYNCHDGKATFEKDQNAEEFAEAIKDYEFLPKWVLDILNKYGLENINYFEERDDPDYSESGVEEKEIQSTVETFTDALLSIMKELNFEKIMLESLENYAGFEKKDNVYIYKVGMIISHKNPQLQIISCSAKTLGEFFDNLASLIILQASDSYRTIDRISLKENVFEIEADLFSS